MWLWLHKELFQGFNLTFSQQWPWRFLSYGLKYHVVWRKSASFEGTLLPPYTGLKSKPSKKLTWSRQLCLMLLQNVDCLSPEYTALYSRIFIFRYRLAKLFQFSLAFHVTPWKKYIVPEHCICCWKWHETLIVFYVFVVKYFALLFQALTSYVASRGFCRRDYEMVINFPRRVLSDMDGTIAVKDLGLHRQETVFVQLRWCRLLGTHARMFKFIYLIPYLSSIHFTEDKNMRLWTRECV